MAFYAYSTNYLIDLKHAVIVEVEASTAIRQAEVTACKTMIVRAKERFDLHPDRLTSPGSRQARRGAGPGSAGCRKPFIGKAHFGNAPRERVGIPGSFVGISAPRRRTKPSPNAASRGIVGGIVVAEPTVLNQVDWLVGAAGLEPATR
jgi:hypothetical protein